MIFAEPVTVRDHSASPEQAQAAWDIWMEQSEPRRLLNLEALLVRQGIDEFAGNIDPAAFMIANKMADSGIEKGFIQSRFGYRKVVSNG